MIRVGVYFFVFVSIQSLQDIQIVSNLDVMSSAKPPLEYDLSTSWLSHPFYRVGRIRHALPVATHTLFPNGSWAIDPLNWVQNKSFNVDVFFLHGTPVGDKISSDAFALQQMSAWRSLILL